VARVILTNDVPDLGSKGDILDVADGYARNYLVPQSLAVAASEGAIRQAEEMRRARIEAERRALDEAESLAQSLVGSRVVVAARAGDEGRLFGSVGVVDVTEAIKKFTGIEVDREIIRIGQPIKEIGLHEVSVQPHPDVEFKVTLDVIPA
jgi:large subunit ribosomal protein L9